jgi:hypothetical protein
MCGGSSLALMEPANEGAALAAPNAPTRLMGCACALGNLYTPVDETATFDASTGRPGIAAGNR